MLGSTRRIISTVQDQKIEAHNARLAVQLGLPSLKYLSRIATMLSIMYGLEQRPFFAGLFWSYNSFYNSVY